MAETREELCSTPYGDLRSIGADRTPALMPLEVLNALRRSEVDRRNSMAGDRRYWRAQRLTAI